MASSTRFLVDSLTEVWLFSTRDTVPVPTCAYRATSWMVATKLTLRVRWSALAYTLVFEKLAYLSRMENGGLETVPPNNNTGIIGCQDPKKMGLKIYKSATDETD